MPKKQKNLISEKTVMDNIIYKVITGSTCYGTNLQNFQLEDGTLYSSDEDKKAVSCLPFKDIVKLGQVWETLTYHDPEDYEIHSLAKFMRLCKENNPTILEMLFADERFVLVNTKYSKILREKRDMFLTKRCIYSYGGYALQQLFKIKADLAEISSSDEIKALHNSLNSMIFSFNDHYGHYDLRIDMEDEELYIKINDTIPLKEFLGMLSEMENCYNSFNKMNHRNRKKDMKQLLKHSMHLIRLLRTGIELAKTGKLVVFRPDREELLEIRMGKRTFEDIFAEAERLHQELLSLKDTCVLPDRVDDEAIEELFYELELMYNRDMGYI